MFHPYYYGPGMDVGYGGGLLMGLISLVFWVLVIWLIVSLLRHGSHGHWHTDSHADHQDPLELAKARYAKGDISKTEFEQIKKDLKD